MDRRLTNFLQEEDGAVTVDWTVMTAAIVGLGIATYGVVSGGINNLSTDVDSHLRTDWISTSFGLRTFATMDFSGGDAGGWIGGKVMDPIKELGDMLVLGPGETASVSLDVPDGAACSCDSRGVKRSRPVWLRAPWPSCDRRCAAPRRRTAARRSPPARCP